MNFLRKQHSVILFFAAFTAMLQIGLVFRIEQLIQTVKAIEPVVMVECVNTSEEPEEPEKSEEPEEPEEVKIVEVVEVIDVQEPVIQEPVIQDEWTLAVNQPSAKTYMDYRAITDRTSNQWSLIYNELTICEDGMLRDQDGYIAAALGSTFGKIGSRWIFVLERSDGTQYELPIIKTDEKQDIHTDVTHVYGVAGEIIEFVIDSQALPVWENGYCYSGNFNNCPEFEGKVIKWKKA